jgi:hypothetical protein
LIKGRSLSENCIVICIKISKDPMIPITFWIKKLWQKIFVIYVDFKGPTFCGAPMAFCEGGEIGGSCHH